MEFLFRKLSVLSQGLLFLNCLAHIWESQWVSHPATIREDGKPWLFPEKQFSVILTASGVSVFQSHVNNMQPVVCLCWNMQRLLYSNSFNVFLVFIWMTLKCHWLASCGDYESKFCNMLWSFKVWIFCMCQWKSSESHRTGDVCLEHCSSGMSVFY